jgi:hypothetical protein
VNATVSVPKTRDDRAMNHRLNASVLRASAARIVTDRAHFFAMAARVTRRILVNAAPDFTSSNPLISWLRAVQVPASSSF